MSYLDKNSDYWSNGYFSPNVESFVFRFYGRLLMPYFKENGWEVNNQTRLVDFGCSQGATVNYFNLHGFDARGCDITKSDLEIAQIRYPHIANKFSICNADPNKNEFYVFKDGVKVVTAIQSLYYFNDTDFNTCIQKLYNSMDKGAIIFATMMGQQSNEFFDNSKDVGDGLRVVNYKNNRMEVKDYFMSFIKDKTHLVNKFQLFKPLHIGYYSMKLLEDEGDGFHYIYCGVKE